MTLNLRALGHITHRLRSIQVVSKGVDYVIKRKISPLFPTFLLLIFENIYFVDAVPVRESLLSSGRPFVLTIDQLKLLAWITRHFGK